MKKINLTLTLITCLISCNKGLKAQGHNLEFEQAVFNTYSVAGDGNNTYDVLLTQTLIVPANKILKISSAYCSASMANGATVGNCYLYIDNIAGFGSGASISLPAGTYTIKITDGATPIYTNNYGYISGILYNIVP